MAQKVRLNIDLKYLINSSFDSPKLRDKARKFLSSNDFKREFGLRVIDQIKLRTQDKNIDKNGAKFKKYSENYIKSLAFQVYGKSTSDVNLTLTSEMLSSMDVTKVMPTQIEIGFISQTQNDKAHGHINGTRSKKGKRQLPVRDFFGLPFEEQKKILKSTMKDFNNGSVLTISEPVTTNTTINPVNLGLDEEDLTD